MVAKPWSLQLCTGKQNAELLAPNDDRFEVGHIDALGHSIVLIASIYCLNCACAAMNRVSAVKLVGGVGQTAKK